MCSVTCSKVISQVNFHHSCEDITFWMFKSGIFVTRPISKWKQCCVTSFISQIEDNHYNNHAVVYMKGSRK